MRPAREHLAAALLDNCCGRPQLLVRTASQVEARSFLRFPSQFSLSVQSKTKEETTGGGFYFCASCCCCSGYLFVVSLHLKVCSTWSNVTLHASRTGLRFRIRTPLCSQVASAGQFLKRSIKYWLSLCWNEGARDMFCTKPERHWTMLLIDLCGNNKQKTRTNQF